MISSRAHLISWLAALALAACSHDAERANPLDASLTPPLALLATIDSTGSVALSWSPYDGVTGMAQTLVLRNVANSVLVDTLARFPDRSTTTWLDTTVRPDVAYEYRVSVVNEAGLEVASQSRSVEGFRTHPVSQLHAESDSLAGVIRLSWPAYEDPRFAEYVVLRRLADSATADTLARIDARGETTWVDVSARHQVDYLYRVDVVAAGRPLPGVAVVRRLTLPSVAVNAAADSRTGSVDLSWAPYSGPRFASYDILRAAGTGTELVATILNPDSTRFVDAGLRGATQYEYWLQVRTTADESVVGERSLAAFHPLVDTIDLPLEGGTAATEYVRLLSASDGEVVTFVAQDTNSIRRVSVDGETRDTLRAYLRFVNQNRLSTRLDAAYVDGPVTWELQYADALVAYHGRTPSWTTTSVVSGLVLPFAVESDSQHVSVELGFSASGSAHVLRDVRLESHRSEANLDQSVVGRSVFLSHLTVDFQDFSLMGSAELQSDEAMSVRISTVLNRRFQEILSATFERSSVVLDWDLADGSDPESRRFPIEPSGISPYRFEIRMESGRLSLDLHHAARWARAETGLPSWSSLAVDDGDLLFTVDDEAFVLPADGTTRELGNLPGNVAEMRVWSVAQERFPRVGICHPDEDLVSFGAMPATSVWSRSVVNQTVGPRLSQVDGGRLFNPISLAGSADGRIYILDAGNSRIVVVDLKGNYITQFGKAGSGPGEFDFGSGDRIGGGADYRGSVIVGDDGRIYVADPDNQRIQVFEP